MTRGRSIVAGLWLALFALPACTVILAEGPTNRCDSDADCVTGTCAVERAMCVSVPREALRVGLEVAPATDPIYSGSARPFAFEPFELSGPTEVDLSLAPGIPVFGVVTDGGGQPITAEVSFSTASLIPGGPASSFSAQSRAETMADGRGFEFNFATQLLPGRVYDVTVRPTGEWAARLPPLRQTYMTPDGDSHRLTLAYPEICSSEVMNDPSTPASCLARVSGVLQNGADPPAPLDGLSVRVVDTVTGQTLSSAFTTGQTVAGGEAEALPGIFEVFLPIERWRDAEGWLIRVTPTAERLAAEGPTQTFTVAPSALFEDALGNVAIRAPEVPDIVDFAGWVEGPDGVPARGASLQFVSRDVVDDATGAVGSFSATATADSEGVFQVTLLAGTYDIIVTPQSDPLQPDLGVARFEERRIDPERPAELGLTEHIPVMGQLFQLPLRAKLGGTVRTVGGEGMLDANVLGRARGTDRGGELPPVSRYARSNNTLTDLNGMFSLGLDVGVYDIVVEPPPGSNYPWLVVPDRAIGGVDTTLSDVFELDNPVPVSGVAAFADPAGGPDIPVANGEIRAYAVIETPGGGTRAVQIGRTTTDAEGNYTLLLPPSL